MGAKHLQSGKFMQAHRRIAERCLLRAGLAAPQAVQIAEDLQTELRSQLGGAKFYVTLGRPDSAGSAARAAALQAQGLSVGDIAARLSVSRASVYRLLAKARDAGRKLEAAL